MTPSTALATIADHDPKSTPPTTEIASGRALTSACGRDPRTIETLAWLREQLDWEDRLAHFRERHDAHCNTDVDRR